MANEGKIIAALIGIGAIGYTLVDKYYISGNWWWERLQLGKPSTQTQVAMLQSSLNAKSRELAQVKQRLSALESPPFSGSKYQITQPSQPLQKPVQPWK